MFGNEHQAQNLPCNTCLFYHHFIDKTKDFVLYLFGIETDRITYNVVSLSLTSFNSTRLSKSSLANSSASLVCEEPSVKARTQLFV